MNKNIINRLIGEMEKLPLIDSHEHLPNESEITGKPADVFTRIYCHYSITNAITAGMPDDRAMLMDTNIPLEKRWNHFKSFHNAIEDTGYARAARITARDLYGIDQINDKTYVELSEKIQATNKPGLYDKILKEKCRIERILNQGSWQDGKDGYAVLVYREFMRLCDVNPGTLRELYETWKRLNGGNFENALDWLSFWCAEIAKDGAVGLKFSALIPVDCVNDVTAENIFHKLREKTISDQEASALGTWLIHKAIASAPKHGFVVAIHCGISWDGKTNFGALNPMNIIPLLMKYWDTVFDLYHGGIPWVREMAVIGNQYPNANLNLVWCHQVSPYMTEHMLNEWIDLVPVNKIIGFGGDNCRGPEKTYGVVRMTFENIARALAVRISRNQITEARAVQICRYWLYENPKRIYGL